jgi:hypothetical protein
MLTLFYPVQKALVPRPAIDKCKNKKPKGKMASQKVKIATTSSETLDIERAEVFLHFNLSFWFLNFYI